GRARLRRKSQPALVPTYRDGAGSGTTGVPGPVQGSVVHTPSIEMEQAVTTAIIGAGNIGSALARNLVRGGERVVLAARDESHAQALAKELGGLATAASGRGARAA